MQTTLQTKEKRVENVTGRGGGYLALSVVSSGLFNGRLPWEAFTASVRHNTFHRTAGRCAVQ